MGLRLDSSAVMGGMRSHYCFSSYYVAFPVGGILQNGAVRPSSIRASRSGP